MVLLRLERHPENGAGRRNTLPQMTEISVDTQCLWSS
jgi:hypothetical protein